LALRYRKLLGVVGRFALPVTGIGALVAAVSFVLLQVQEWFWAGAMLGLILHSVGALVFGLLHLRTPLLPEVRGLPLVAGLGPLLLQSGMFLSGDGPQLGGFAIIALYAAAWIGIGVAIQRHPSRPTAFAA
jgi:hypothetical protein